MFTQLENDHFEAHFTRVLWSKKQCDCGHIKAEKSAPPKSRNLQSKPTFRMKCNTMCHLGAEKVSPLKKYSCHLRPWLSFLVSIDFKIDKYYLKKSIFGERCIARRSKIEHKLEQISQNHMFEIPQISPFLTIISVQYAWLNVVRLPNLVGAFTMVLRIRKFQKFARIGAKLRCPPR